MSTAYCCQEHVFKSTGLRMYDLALYTKDAINYGCYFRTCCRAECSSKDVVACVLYGPLNRRPKKETKTFGTTVKELLKLQD